MGKLSRTKGVRFERWVATSLRVVWPNAKRGIGQARSGGEVPDVDVPGWWHETKHRKRVCARAALEQAEAAAYAHGGGRAPVAICKEDRGTPFVVMRFSEYLSLQMLVADCERRHRALMAGPGATDE